MANFEANSDCRAPVAVLGAGLAGLAAAASLRRRGQSVIVYEAGKAIAGLAQSFHDDDGFTYDFGAHFITNRLAAAVGIGDRCRTVRYYGESVHIHGRTYGYPFGLLGNPRYLRDGLASRLRPADPHLVNRSAADWFRYTYGRALADEVALPLLEAWSGAPAAELSAAVGNKLQGGIAQALYLKLAAKLSGRAVANGYSHEMPEHPQLWHVYPEGGLGTLCAQLAQGLESAIHLETPVEAILVENEQVQAVRVNGQEQPVSAVISTAPCPLLARLVKGSDRVAAMARFRYRPMVFVNLRLEGRGLLPDTVLWLPEAKFPTFRLTETPLSMPWLAPEGKTLITVDIGCQVGDAIWSMDDESLGQFCLDHLEPLIPDIRRRYLGARALKTPIAYPVYLNEYEGDRQRFEAGTGIAGLYSLGRNGEFAHILMEDIYWRTQDQTRALSSPPASNAPASTLALVN
ncbi:protoporphyrinogen/coproporphyrinogen oxidase [Nodosilinea nodulosa]|uniref:protoporphyrinogen/coproporphyrinogen oxidase n=1 Tax=Nodosilinea nodulosa TaxID=416001 RepID=UPI0002E3A16C|nr:FAD-dependent oxidoreductase [Nodosilinea nodulosa]